MSAERATDAAEIVKIELPEITVPVGGTATAVIILGVEAGYHIQAHAVVDEYLLPTRLEFQGLKGILIDKMMFPQSTKLSLEGYDTPVHVYEGNVNVRIRVTAKEACTQGRKTLKATLTYQACDAKRCFSPRTVEFNLSVDVR